MRDRFRDSDRDRPGFTLVEFLVVIGVIAVLIAILMPALLKAREAAMSVECESNLRQVTMAVILYANSSNGYLPYDNQWTQTWDQRVAQVTGLPHDPSKTSGTIWTCPFVAADGFGNDWTYYGRWSMHYGMNSNYMCSIADPGTDDSVTDNNPSFWKLDRCKPTSILLSDFSPIYSATDGMYFWSSVNTSWPQSFAGGTWGNFAPWPVDPKNGKLDLQQWHAKRFNASFMDGHVESEATLDPTMWVQ
jgi:prepilin-type N-terminal cleavage/methylation domain-containing protein/prepilin-type processing-associated H-X9-DG protein